MENTESKHFHHESYCRKCNSLPSDNGDEVFIRKINHLEESKEKMAKWYEREIEITNERMIEIKQKQASLIAAVNWAISEYPSDRASKYLDTIIENLFSK
jgi:tyrosine-protein phosphatase YwqE